MMRLRRLKDSMALSTSTDLNTSPAGRKGRTSISKRNRRGGDGYRRRPAGRAPTSMPENFFRIMAAMSVPPVEALMLNRIAEPNAGG